MLSLHVVQCVIEWRKQLITNFLLTNKPPSKQHPEGSYSRNSLKKFKSVPFIWESQNYLLKMMSDTSETLCTSHFSRYLNFTKKNDPFLVYPSLKHVNEAGVAQGTGMQGIKRLRAASNNSIHKFKKLTLPLQTTLMKVIRQCEVYLMEEAVTDQILKSTT